MDNDRTIGRTNVRASTNNADHLAPSSTSSNSTNDDDNIAQQKNPLAAPPPPSTTTTAAVQQPPPPPATMTSPGGSYQWPTSSEYYELSNRIGQGAFASVWRARTIRNNKKQLVTSSSSGNGEEDNKKEKDQGQQHQVECAIKIMDLEHVNINISGESIHVIEGGGGGIDYMCILFEDSIVCSGRGGVDM